MKIISSIWHFGDIGNIKHHRAQTKENLSFHFLVLYREWMLDATLVGRYIPRVGESKGDRRSTYIWCHLGGEVHPKGWGKVRGIGAVHPAVKIPMRIHFDGLVGTMVNIFVLISKQRISRVLNSYMQNIISGYFLNKQTKKGTTISVHAQNLINKHNE